MFQADLSRNALARYSVDLRQFIDFRQSTLTNGLRLVGAYNSSGLTFTLLPDRGLDIWSASSTGCRLPGSARIRRIRPILAQTGCASSTAGCW